MSVCRGSVLYYSGNPFGYDDLDLDFLCGGSLATPHPTFSDEANPFVNAKIDWKETPEAYVIKADLPGVRREEVKVELGEGNVLRLTVERIVEKEQRSYHGYHVERTGGRFVRSFKLPENARASKMKAALDNGVLTITIPRKEMKETRRVIQIY